MDKSGIALREQKSVLQTFARQPLALARGKKGPDRRDDLKKKAVAREAQQSFKGKYRG